MKRHTGSKNPGTDGCEGIEGFCSDLWKGFIDTGQAAFPHQSFQWVTGFPLTRE